MAASVNRMLLPSFQEFIQHNLPSNGFHPSPNTPLNYDLVSLVNNNNSLPQSKQPNSDLIYVNFCADKSALSISGSVERGINKRRRTKSGATRTTDKNVTLHKCSLCNFETRYGYYLSRHMRVHTNEKPFECKVCHKSFKSKCYLRIHMRIHNSEKVCVCPYCKYTCCDQSNLQKHIRTHTGEKPYRCSVCSLSFAQSGSLKRHAKTHLAVPSTPPPPPVSPSSTTQPH